MSDSSDPLHFHIQPGQLTLTLTPLSPKSRYLPPSPSTLTYPRVMMHATLATLVMYYAERFEAEEMHSVLTKMRDAYRPIAAPNDDARPTARRHRRPAAGAGVRAELPDGELRAGARG